MRKLILMSVLFLIMSGNFSRCKADEKVMQVEWFVSGDSLIIYNAYEANKMNALRPEDVKSLLIEVKPHLVPTTNLLHGAVGLFYAKKESQTFLEAIGLTEKAMIDFRKNVLKQVTGPDIHIWRTQWFNIHNAFMQATQPIKIGDKTILIKKIVPDVADIFQNDINRLFTEKRPESVFPHLISGRVALAKDNKLTKKQILNFEKVEEENFDTLTVTFKNIGYKATKVQYIEENQYRQFFSASEKKFKLEPSSEKTIQVFFKAPPFNHQDSTRNHIKYPAIFEDDSKSQLTLVLEAKIFPKTGTLIDRVFTRYPVSMSFLVIFLVLAIAGLILLVLRRTKAARPPESKPTAKKSELVVLVELIRERMRVRRWIKANAESLLTAIFQTAFPNRPIDLVRSSPESIEENINQVKQVIQLGTTSNHQDMMITGENEALRLLENLLKALLGETFYHNNFKLQTNLGLDSNRNQIDRIKSFFDGYRKEYEASTDLIEGIRREFSLTDMAPEEILKELCAYGPYKTFVEKVYDLFDLDRRMKPDKAIDTLLIKQANMRQSDEFIQAVNMRFVAPDEVPIESLDQVSDLIDSEKRRYQQLEFDFQTFKNKLGQELENILGYSSGEEKIDETLTRVLPELSNEMIQRQDKINQLNRQLEANKQQQKYTLEQIQPFLQYIDFSTDDFLAKMDPERIDAVVKYLEQTRALVPDFIKKFEHVVNTMYNGILDVYNYMNPNSVFRGSFKSLLYGERNNAGLRETRDTLGPGGDRKKLLSILGFGIFHSLINLDKKMFYDKYLQSHFLNILHSFMRLYFYKNIEVNDIAIKEDYLNDNIKVEILDDLFLRLKFYLKDELDIQLSEIKLYHDKFDETIHTRAEYQMLIRLNDRYDIRHQLERGVIIDIKSVGIKSKGLDLDIKPEVVYKIS